MMSCKALHHLCVSLIVMVVVLHGIHDVDGAATVYTVAHDYPQSGGSGLAGERAFVGFQIAMEEYVNSSTIEMTYHPISLTKLDDRSQNELGIKNAYESYNAGIAIIIGAFNSGVTSRLATVAARFAGPIVTPASNSPSLSNRKSFPTLSRVTYSSAQIADVYAQICDFYKWKKVGVMHTDDLFATGSADAFKAAAVARGITIVDTLVAPFGIAAQNFDLGPGMAQLKAGTNIYFAAATGADGTEFMKAGEAAGNWGVEGFQWLVNGFGSAGTTKVNNFGRENGFRGMLDLTPGWNPSTAEFIAFRTKYHQRRGSNENDDPVEANSIYSYDTTKIALKAWDATVAEVISLA